MKREKKREKKRDRKKARWWQGEKGKEDGGWKHTNGNELKKAGKQRDCPHTLFCTSLGKRGARQKTAQVQRGKREKKPEWMPVYVVAYISVQGKGQGKGGGGLQNAGCACWCRMHVNNLTLSLSFQLLSTSHWHPVRQQTQLMTR